MYRNDRTERARLSKLWITEQNKPCSKCGSFDRREIAHIIPAHLGGQTTENNCKVLCRRCNLAESPGSKFRLGDRVILNGRTPNHIELARHRPRTIVAIRYNPERKCNYYKLGSNARGNMSGNGNPLDGYTDFWFRSYHLERPRRYHYRSSSIHQGQKSVPCLSQVD